MVRARCVAAAVVGLAVAGGSLASGEDVRSLIDEADALLMAWQAASSNPPDGGLTAADQARLDGLVRDALAKVEAARRLPGGDRSWRVEHRLGVCLSLSGRYAEAEQALAEAERLVGPDDLPIVLQDRGLCAMHQKQYDRAMEYFQRILKLRDWQPDTRFHMGRIYELRGDRERALQLYTEELNTNTRNPKAWAAYFRLKAEPPGEPRRGWSLRNTLIILGLWLAVVAAVGLYAWRRRLKVEDRG